MMTTVSYWHIGRPERRMHLILLFSFFSMPLTASRRDTLGAAGCFVSNHTLQKSEWGQACMMEGSCIILYCAPYVIVSSLIIAAYDNNRQG